MRNEITDAWTKLFIKNPQASLIIENNDDLYSVNVIIKDIYNQTVGISKDKLQNYKYEDKNSVGIDEVKDLLRTLKLKADASEGVSRFIVIHGAERLTLEAQNVLLKTIEELPKSTVLILSVNNKQNLLKTIQSRCFLIPILPISITQAKQYATTNNIDKNRTKTAYLLSEGNFSKYLEYLENEDSAIYTTVKQAKEFVSSSVFERQIFVNTLKNAEETQEFINALKLVATAGMRNATEISNKLKWKQVTELVLKTIQYLKSNTNVKLALMNLSVELP